MGEPVIVPCLKEADWEGQADMVCRPLWTGARSPYVPWVAFGQDHPTSFAFMATATLVKLGKTAEQVEREAVRNLRLRKGSWKKGSIKLGFFRRLKLLVCADDFLTAERILDGSFMVEAQRRLGARDLAVGIPRRGVLMATDAGQEARKLERFLKVVALQHFLASSAPISPAAFTLRDGRITGILDAAVDAARAVVSAAAQVDGKAQPAGDPGEPYVSGMAVKGEHGLDLVIVAVGRDAGRLAAAVEEFFVQLLEKYLPKPEFSGRFEIVVPADAPDAFWQQLPSLVRHLETMATETSARTQNGRPIAVAVRRKDAVPF